MTPQLRYLKQKAVIKANESNVRLAKKDRNNQKAEKTFLLRYRASK